MDAMVVEVGTALSLPDQLVAKGQRKSAGPAQHCYVDHHAARSSGM